MMGLNRTHTHSSTDLPHKLVTMECRRTQSRSPVLGVSNAGLPGLLYMNAVLASRELGSALLSEATDAACAQLPNVLAGEQHT